MGPPSLNADARMNGIACSGTRAFGKVDDFQVSFNNVKLLTIENILLCVKEATRKLDEMEKAMTSPPPMFPNKQPQKPTVTLL